MRRRRLPLGLVAPVALLVLVGALATLQYKWVGQVSEAERAQLSESLDRRVRDFADEFDREIGSTFRAFQLAAAPFDPAAPTAFVAKLGEWQATARFAGMLESVWFIRPTEDRIHAYRYDGDQRVFVPAEWPAELAAVRTRLQRRRLPFETPVAGATIMVSATSPILPEIPAILVPVQERSPEQLGAAAGTGIAPGMMVAIHLDDSQLLLQLDRDYLQQTMLPALAATHFPESDRYRVAIVDAQTRVMYSRGVDPARALTRETADAGSGFFSLRFDALREAVSLRVSETVHARSVAAPARRTATIASPSGKPLDNKLSWFFEQRTGPTTEVVRLAPGSWQVLVQHAAGSLDAAVADARRRNLWLSFGILAVLAASVGLIVVNARRSERLAAQQMDFVATVSHELRTPLAVIRSAAQNLSAGVVHEAAQASKYGELIETEGRRLTDMVEQVLEYAGVSGNRRAVRAAPVDCAALVRDVVAAQAPLLEAERFEVVVDAAPDLPPALADEGAVRRSVVNLVTNALKYAADGRWLGVSVRQAQTRGRTELQIAVADRGRGIAADDLPHIFEPFYRGRYALERQIHGNGLGLSLVKRIAEAHGGRVTVKSATGEGSTFTIHLPAASPDPAVSTLSDPLPGTGTSPS